MYPGTTKSALTSHGLDVSGEHGESLGGELRDAERRDGEQCAEAQEGAAAAV